MTMSTYNRRPQVLAVDPSNHATKVDTTLNKLTLDFNTDLSQENIGDSFRLETESGEAVSIEMTYDNRVVTVHIKERIQPNETYRLTVLGDSDLEDETIVGIRNVFDSPMAGNYVTTFSTVEVDTLPAPKTLHPAHLTTTKSTPSFSWEASADAEVYELQVSKTNTLIPLLWETTVKSREVHPMGTLADGVYYWRLRAVDVLGNPGDWTELQHFFMDTTVRGPVTEEDTVADDIFKAKDFFDVDLEENQFDMYASLESYEMIAPSVKTKTANLPTNLKTLTFRILGDVQKEDIAIEVQGESITGEEEDHGELKGSIEIESQSDGTTLVHYTFLVIGAEESE